MNSDKEDKENQEMDKPAHENAPKGFHTPHKKSCHTTATLLC